MKLILTVLSAIFLTGSVSSVTASNYSNAVNAGDFVYISGQFPIDPITGKMIEGDMETLTNQVIDNMQHLLHLNGVTMKQVIKTEVYLTDVRDFQAMDSVYGKRFNYQYPPARDVVVVSDLLNNSRIEISCIAYKLRHY